jgi:Concanavalin A-like lectin/glucanases superfamily
MGGAMPTFARWLLAVICLVALLGADAVASPRTLRSSAAAVYKGSGVNSGDSCVPVPEGIVSWWPGESDPAGIAVDINDANKGRLRGDVSFAPAEVGEGFAFDGQGDFITVPNAHSLNPSSEITLEAWIFATGQEGAGADLLSKDGEGSDRQYLLAIGANTQRFRAHIGVLSGFRNFDGVTVVQLETWYHAAMTYDGAVLKLYVNGALDGSLSVTGSIIRTSQPVRIGGGSPDGLAKYFFQGLIDEADIFDRALTDAEVQAIYQAGAGGKCRGQRASKLWGVLQPKELNPFGGNVWVYDRRTKKLVWRSPSEPTTKARVAL